MNRELAVLLTVIAGGFVALQAPINSRLGKTVGTFTASSLSFLIGTIVLVAIALLAGGAFDRVGHVSTLPWYYLLGGVLGAVYVTTVLVSVRTLGAGGVTAATITGQLAASVTIDRLGILGLAQKPLSASRIAGLVLLAAGVFLVVRD